VIALNTFEVIGYTKPNCDLQMLLSIGNQDIKNLTNMDILVLIGGMNDVTSDNSSKDLWHISQFVKHNTQTNIILLTTPLRYDQESNVHLNYELKKFNRKLWKLRNLVNMLPFWKVLNIEITSLGMGFILMGMVKKLFVINLH
jgi:hypothetical protein